MVRAQKKFSATRQCQISSSEPGKEFVGKAERQYSSILDTGPMPLFQESATASLKDLVRWTSHASIFHQNGTIQAPHSRRKMLRLKAKPRGCTWTRLSESWKSWLLLHPLPLELGVSWSLEMATAAMRSCGHPDVCPSDFVHADNILTHSENGSGLKTIRSSLWVSCAGPAQLMHKSRQELMDPMQSHDSWWLWLLRLVTCLFDLVPLCCDSGMASCGAAKESKPQGRTVMNQWHDWHAIQHCCSMTQKFGI
jgi:hypothetical protein